MSNLSIQKTNSTFFFLNGLAHLQHHYFFSSSQYKGAMSNPEWYISNKDDPILDALGVYDRIFDLILSRVDDGEAIFFLTAISQQPYDIKKFYYRLRNHADFLTKVGIKFDNVQPGMTRDFTISFSEESDRDHAVSVLDGLTLNNEKIFSISVFQRNRFSRVLPIRTKFPQKIGYRVAPVY